MNGHSFRQLSFGLTLIANHLKNFSSLRANIFWSERYLKLHVDYWHLIVSATVVLHRVVDYIQINGIRSNLVPA